MAKRQKDWARRRRNTMFDVLGNKCAYESLGGCEGELTVDCIIPQGHAHHKIDASHRQCFYHKQLKAGNLQLLCVAHQALKSVQEKMDPVEPF